MKFVAMAVAALLMVACAAPGESREARKNTAVTDLIEINDLAPVDSIRTMDQLEARKVTETYIIVSTRREHYLLEYYSRCMRRPDGRVEPDVRRDSRALYPRIDTFRGCRIKEIYALEPGQVDELRNLGESVGGE